MIILKMILSFLLTILLIFLGLKRYKIYKLRKAILKENENTIKDTAINITKSIANARKLYKELISQVHPDRFSENQVAKATELAANITKYKRNYSELTKLKEEVELFIASIPKTDDC